jgi:hypothetical protein
LPVKTISSRVTLGVIPTAESPPPPPPTLPPVTVIPDIVRLDATESNACRPGSIPAPFRWTVRSDEPGPMMVSGAPICAGVEAIVIVRGTEKKTGSKVMVSGPGAMLASRIAWRRLPEPESRVLVTMSAGVRRSSSASTRTNGTDFLRPPYMTHPR